VVDSHRGLLFAGVLVLLRDFTLAGVAARKADGVATFQDLLAWARDLLRDHADVRRRAQARYQCLFVDEFQDTDPLQAEIAFYLAAEPEAPLPHDWRDLPLVPGKLFVVGDPKQSIYRFRRADIAVYDSLLRRLRHAQAHLIQNFRSVRPVIEWVNHHFAGHMIEAEGVQPPYVALAARWERFDGQARCGVYRLGGALDAPAPQAAAIEANALAQLAQQVVEEGWLVSERGPDGERVLRPATYRDIGILLPTRTHLRRLERALEAEGVPYRIESGALMLGTQEVRDLLTCLRAIEDPSDQVALVGALRSPAFGCSDPDLLRWVEGGGRLDHEDPGDGPGGPVQDALACLASFYSRRHTLSPPALIEAFIRDRLLVLAAFGEPRPRETWRRLRYVVARARQFTATGRHTLRAFLDWIDGLARAEVRDAESAEAEPDEDALRILTIHGSKGLEFPVVLLAGLGSSWGGGFASVEVIPDRATGVLACRAGGWRTPDFEAAKAREQVMEAQEAIRLLYVAGTRARDHLVLSLFRGARGQASAAARIERSLDGLLSECHHIALPPVRLTTGRQPSAPAAHRPDLTAADFANPAFEQVWLAQREELVRQLAAPRVASWGPGDETLWGWEDEGAAVPPEPTRPDVGLRVRALVRRAHGTDFGATAEDDPTVRARAQAILMSDAYGEALASGAWRREVRLLGTDGPVMLDVTAALIFETQHGTVLVLYDLADMADTTVGGPWTVWHRAGLLALALRQAAGRSASAVLIVHAGDGGSTSRIEDLAAAVAAARSALSEAPVISA
jgi:ATP-dependent exoDNAse (exonuclease V) beta subunit